MIHHRNEARRAARRAFALAALLVSAVACGDDGPLGSRDDGPERQDVDHASFDAPFDVAIDAAIDDGIETAGDLAPDPARGDEAVDGPDSPPTSDAVPDAPSGAELPGVSCPPAGAVIITELLPDPAVVPDDAGEYVEIHNPGETPVDLRGLDLRSGPESHAIRGESPVLVPARGFLVLAVSGNPDLNGGIAAGYVYDGVRLSNEADDVGLYCGDTLIDRVSWNAASYPLATGASLSLDRTGFDAVRNDDAAYWCRGIDAAGAGPAGTPGSDNPPCAPSSCGDRRIQRWEECDDGNLLPGDGCSASCRRESFAPGSVIVTEFLVRPIGADRTAGQWIELHNPAEEPIDITGWALEDEAGARVRILPADGPLVVPGFGYVVLGRSADREINGGVDVDWAYGDRFPLGIPTDRIVLTWSGRVIDRVDWSAGSPFPESAGRSTQLDPDLADADLNDRGSAWCPAPDDAVLPDGDRGSPGLPNPPCPGPAASGVM